MSLQLGQGYAPYLLSTLAEVAGSSAPEYKITPTGFLKACIENDPGLDLPEIEANKLSVSTEAGNIRSIQIAYGQRITPDQVQSSRDCTNNLIPTYREMAIDVSGYKQFGFAITNDTIQRYPKEYANSVAIGKAPTPFMLAFVKQIYRVANGLLGAIDTDLIGKVLMGKNITNGNSGNNTPTTLNFNKNGQTFDFTEGITGLLDQVQKNEMFVEDQELIFVGAGKFNAFQNSVLRAVGPNAAGYNAAAMNGLYKWYRDLYWESVLGTDTIGVFQPGTFGFVDLQRYIGAFAENLGVYETFSMPIPIGNGVNSDGTANIMDFDCRLVKITCPTSIQNGYGQTVTVQDGWVLYMGKNYGLFQLPADAYQPNDRLFGNNGSLLYKATNDCVSC